MQLISDEICVNGKCMDKDIYLERPYGFKKLTIANIFLSLMYIVYIIVNRLLTLWFSIF